MPNKASKPLGPNGDCSECGQRHWRQGKITCAAHVVFDRDSYVKGQDRKRLDKPRACMHAPSTGLEVCVSHGGRAKQAQAAGKRRDVEARAAAVLRRFGQPIDTTPTEALLDAVKWTAGYVAWLRDKVASAESDNELTQHSAISGKAEASAWVDLLGDWHDRLVRICSEAIRAGIEERRVRLAEQQGALVADVIRKIAGAVLEALIAAGIPQQFVAVFRSALAEAAPRHLRALAAS